MGLGDWIMATAEARRLKQAFPDAKVVIGDGKAMRWEHFFDGNPNLTKPEDVKPGDEVAWVYSHAGNRPYLDYGKCTDTHQAFREDFRPTPGEIHIGDNFKLWADQKLKEAKVHGPFIILEPNTKGTMGGNKDWPFDRWQELVRKIGRATSVVQLGAADKRALSGVHRIPTHNFISALAIMDRAKLVVTTDGGLHHAAAAMNKPAVVIWGSRTNPKILGYPQHKNLYSGDGVSCGAIVPCRHCREGMEAITVDQVWEAVKSLL
jgi:ADP-heptose:LPS heptosyltransferase